MAFLSVVESTGKEKDPLLEVVVVLFGPFCEESNTYTTIKHRVTTASSKKAIHHFC